MLFGGNLVRQPAFVQLNRDSPDAFRVVDGSSFSNPRSTIHDPPSPLPAADRIMNHTIFLGTYPGLTREMLDYIVETIRKFVLKK
jgi:CDP-6-deoxy-D-xylo-4-hexulose-3-dehydrase